MKIRKVFAVLFLLASCSLSLAACSSGVTQEEIPDKKIIAVTIVPEKTFAEAVCGDLAEVVVMVPPGSNPENYEPTPQEMKLLEKSSLYFTIGVPTEEANILPEIGDIKTISLQDEVAKMYPDREFRSGERDPHIWMSPKRAEVMVETIAREMGKIDSKNKEIYNDHAQEYIKKLDLLDEDIADTLRDVKNKKFIVYHPAFGYLADDYGLQMYALEEEGKEATINHLQDMIDLAKEENVKVIFYQEEIDSSQSAAFAEEIGGKTMQLAPLAPDYIENLERMAEIMRETMR